MWSGGKDAVLALEALARDERWELRALVTTVSEHDERVTMHGVARTLIARQAQALDLPLYGMHIPAQAPNAVYEARLDSTLSPLAVNGIDAVAFGDVHLDDVRAYRESLLDRLGFEGVFPIWGEGSGELAERFLELNYRALVTSVDEDRLPRHAAGCPFDRAFLDNLPSGIDRCGERGEFHTFTFAGPRFGDAIPFHKRDGYSIGSMWVVPLDPEGLDEGLELEGLDEGPEREGPEQEGREGSGTGDCPELGFPE